MRKAKYYYNPATCSYESIKTSILACILRGCGFIALSLVLASAIVRYYKGHFVSPKEAELLADNTKLKTYYIDIQRRIESSTKILNALQEREDTLRVLLNRNPLSTAERDAGMGGVDKYAHLGKETLIAQTLSKVDQLISKLNIQKKSYDYILGVAKTHVSTLKSKPTFPPLSKKHLKRISGSFGMRLHPIFKIRKMHEGVDFAAPMYTPIYAAADGYVKSLKNDKKGLGNHLLLEHGNGFQTLYAHMYSITVKERQKIVRGQQIGTVGSSGASTGPHLHYEIFQNRNRVDPVQYFAAELSAAEHDEVCKQAANQTQTLCY
ncbi:M23 family metallopeptidase [Candidatus Cardinium hertigii]|jgi:murein DD-endopeptidase MepM/ murein hydrolase activator NlpD|uniref:M23 family metallopeptidase n=1 Tax=Candidatus Cardinium hertigii TaxID=247481 RepID=A0A3N2QD63_9BACT|nr:M23 family metallopeptidase [Candidatus Cardinium hertigii]ROT47753.1 M23 family metallopeptidase [Candidatus Cardinium hertigii]